MSHIASAVEHELQALNRRSVRLGDRAPAVGGGLARSSYAILGLLHDEGPQRIGRIATAFELDPSTLTRQVKAVVEQGFATRQQDPRDQRATVLHLSELGRSTVSTVRVARGEAVADLLRGWSPEDRETFLRLLTQFNADSSGWPRLTRLPHRSDVSPQHGGDLA